MVNLRGEQGNELTRPRNAWNGFIASSLEHRKIRHTLNRSSFTYYRARYLLMSSARLVGVAGIGSRVDGLEESSR